MQQLTIAAGMMQWPFLAGVVIIASTVLTAIWKLAAALHGLTAPLMRFITEHDVLWEDYNIRTGGSYRRSIGRGSPPEPEDFYRTAKEG